MSTGYNQDTNSPGLPALDHSSILGTLSELLLVVSCSHLRVDKLGHVHTQRLGNAAQGSGADAPACNDVVDSRPGYTGAFRQSAGRHTGPC